VSQIRIVQTAHAAHFYDPRDVAAEVLTDKDEWAVCTAGQSTGQPHHHVMIESFAAMDVLLLGDSHKARLSRQISDFRSGHLPAPAVALVTLSQTWTHMGDPVLHIEVCGWKRKPRETPGSEFSRESI
jgi:hypothetical protein